VYVQISVAVKWLPSAEKLPDRLDEAVKPVQES
jgi:hypothetical protein